MNYAATHSIFDNLLFMLGNCFHLNKLDSNRTWGFLRLSVVFFVGFGYDCFRVFWSHGRGYRKTSSILLFDCLRYRLGIHNFRVFCVFHSKFLKEICCWLLSRLFSNYSFWRIQDGMPFYNFNLCMELSFLSYFHRSNKYLCFFESGQCSVSPLPSLIWHYNYTPDGVQNRKCE